MYYVYCIYSDRKDLYIGYTKDLKARIESHNAVKNKSTRGKEWMLVYCEAYLSKSDAVRREKRLKQHGQAKRFLKERIEGSIAQAMLS